MVSEEGDLGPIPQTVVSPLEKPPSRNTAPVDFQTEGVTNTPDDTADTPMSDETEADTIDETEMLDMADAFLPDDVVSADALDPLFFPPMARMLSGTPRSISLMLQGLPDASA
ncbi:MAG: hypothetical protein OXH00_04010 [Candidatus Poribacteria bacterium]|nr:hypothetical protein [Candidatus Poribacteria bacterium]